MSQPAPRHVVVVGAGMVGLSVAWFLQEAGVEVTVVDREGIAAGSSWGNAGWVSPGLAIPLPEPSVLRYGLRNLLRADSPLFVPPALDLSVASFLVKFARHCTEQGWKKAMEAYIPLNNQALEAFDLLAGAGAGLESKAAPIMAAFRRREEASELLGELEMINRAGQIVQSQELGGAELRKSLPGLSEAVDFGVRIDGQRYIDPGAFTAALGATVLRRGAILITNKIVEQVRRDADAVVIRTDDGTEIRGDVGVLAVGAWMNSLAKPLGVKMPVQAGRGYSFLVPVSETVAFPIYFPAVRVACTPMGERTLRVAGTMEFRAPDFRLDPARVAAIVRSAVPLLEGVDWDSKRADWVGPRPVTADGMPLIGQSKMPGVYIAGGHGMWGITLGPVTGKLLARQIVTGEIPDELRPFDPIR